MSDLLLLLMAHKTQSFLLLQLRGVLGLLPVPKTVLKRVLAGDAVLLYRGLTLWFWSHPLRHILKELLSKAAVLKVFCIPACCLSFIIMLVVIISNVRDYSWKMCHVFCKWCHCDHLIWHWSIITNKGLSRKLDLVKLFDRHSMNWQAKQLMDIILKPCL